MDANAPRRGPLQDVRQRIDVAEAGRAHGRDDRADVAAVEQLVEVREVHVAGGRASDRAERDSEHVAEARVGVMRLFGGDDALAGMQAARYPQCLEIGHRAAAREMAERRLPAEHPAEFADAFLFHRRAGAAAVEGVVVGVDPQRQGVGDPRNGMRWLEHLPGVKRVVIGIVVLHTDADLLQHIGHRVDVELGREAWQIRKTFFESFQRGAKHMQFGGVDHPFGPLCQRRELTVKTPASA